MHGQMNAKKPTLVRGHVSIHDNLSKAIRQLANLMTPLSGIDLGFIFSNVKKSILAIIQKNKSYRLSDDNFQRLMSVASRVLSDDSAVNISGRDAATIISSFAAISTFNNKEQSRAFLNKHAISLANIVVHDSNATSRQRTNILWGLGELAGSGLLSGLSSQDQSSMAQHAITLANIVAHDSNSTSQQRANSLLCLGKLAESGLLSQKILFDFFSKHFNTMIDLHEWSRECVEQLLKLIKESQPVATTLITGKGLHSIDRSSVLQTFIKNFCESNNIACEMDCRNAGRLIITPQCINQKDQGNSLIPPKQDLPRSRSRNSRTKSNPPICDNDSSFRIAGAFHILTKEGGQNNLTLPVLTK